MTTPDTPTEEELHAYVDGLLPDERVLVVQAYLASHPDEAARIAAWRLQISKIRDRFGPVADEPVPPRLLIENLQSRPKTGMQKIAAVAMIAFALGAGAGWLGRDLSNFGRNTDSARALAMAAIEAHRIYVSEVRHPIEVRADEDHLVPWLSRRVGSPLKAPDLQPEGLKLLGGRLIAGPNGPTAFFMYEGGNGDRVTLTTARAGNEGETSFQWRANGEVGAVAWFERGLAFVVAGPAQQDRLDRVARRVFDAYEVADNGAATKK